MAKEAPLRKKIIKSILDILVLQLIKNEPMQKDKIINKLNSKFNVSIPSSDVCMTLSSLEKQGLITNNPKFTLTKKGNIIRFKLLKDYFNLQKTIRI